MKTLPNLFFYLLAFTLTIAGEKAVAQLKANFSADNTTGCAPLIVKFSDASSGGPTQWKWDLGNGTVSYLKNPSASYFSPGTYTIKLIVQNSSGSDTILKQKFITVQGQPIVNFISSAGGGCYPLPVQFTDQTTTPFGVIKTWEWDFGDGNLSSIQNPFHVYTGSGDFNVSLRVTTTSGCVKSVTKKGFVKIASGVKASFTNSVSTICAPPAIINFTNTSTGSGNLNYNWDFGDSSYSSEVNPSHTYYKKGLYSVRLIVTSSKGCTDTFTKINSVDLRSVNAGFSFPSLICAGNHVIFKNTGNPIPTSNLWYINEKNFSNNSDASILFDSAGTFTIKLISAFGSCKDSSIKSIVVQSKPKADFTSNNTVSCKAPVQINFTSKSSNANQYLWKFGDGDSSSLSNPIHNYNKIGSYTVTLIVTNSSGCSDTVSKPSFINISAPKATILGLPTSGCIPYTNNFHCSIQSVDSVTSYKWDFGDSTNSLIQNPSHQYLKPGVFTIKLYIHTAGGCTDSAIVPKGVAAGYHLNTKFDASPRNVCAFIPISFNDSTKGLGTDEKGNPDQWLWIYGDGNTSTDRYSQHLYHDTGYFTISLVAYNYGCPDTATYKNFIHISAPVSKFTYTYNCNNKFSRVFTNTSEGADTWHWNFGDGTSSYLQNPEHVYEEAGVYAVSLLVTNKISGCENTNQQNIQIVNEKSNFSADQTEICKSLAVNFQTINVNFINVKNIIWNFGDGTLVNADAATISHTYLKAGIYNVSLIVNDKLGCSDTLLKPTFITVNSPVANFSNIAFSCVNSNVNFIDSSKNDGLHAIKLWEWNYGEANQSTTNYSKGPFNHSYNNAGNYSISLKVTDVNGCADIITKINALHISKAIANFNADSLSCTGSSIVFNNLSKDTIINYLWNFGDNNISTSLNPLHKYLKVGKYDVSLKIKDKYGCTDSLLKTNFIIIADPKALFTISDSFSNCPPLVVSFYNQSKNGIQYYWDFGDGNNSTLLNPTHFYSTAGIYSVVLKVTAAGGCIDIMTKTVVIKGPSGSFTYNFLHGCAPFTSPFLANVKNTTSILWDFNDGSTKNTTTNSTDHIYLQPGAFIPKIILMDNSGCKVPLIGKDTINVYDIKGAFGFTTSQFCDSLVVNFKDSSLSNDFITSYNWSFEDGENSTMQDPIHVYNNSGTYNAKLQVETLEGCTSTVEQNIIVDLIIKPRIGITSLNESCAQSDFKFDGTINNPNSHRINWVWDFGNNATSNVQNPGTIKYNVSGNYKVSLIGFKDGGCRDTVYKNIVIHPLPELKIEAKTTLCKGEMQSLVATGADSFVWSPATGLSCFNCSSPIMTGNNNVQYNLSGKSLFGCSSNDSIIIKVQQPFDMKVSNGDSLCNGNSVQLGASGAVSYIWSPSSGLSSPTVANPVARPSVTTKYMVIGSNNETCFKDTGYVLVNVFPIPVISAGQNKTINAGESVQLVPNISSDVINVHWTPTIGITGSNYPSITVKPSQTTEYTIEAVNAGTCRARDKVTVFVLCNNANVFIPNTFSPNGDGTNEIFYPRGTGLFSIKSFRIFNRWGEMVYQRSEMRPNDPSVGWDGRYKGVKLTSDVFIYIMEVVCENNITLTYKGNVALIR